MSTFSGKIEDIPGISIDNFMDDVNKNQKNSDSEVYFLSHCHTDHMKGLNNDTVQKFLVERSKYLYASKVSCLILKKKFPGIKDNVRILDMHSNTRIQVKDDIICVTSIPAGHCPGSVMFLFEIPNGKTILYTGDYRINPRDLTKFNGFYDSSNQLKAIDKMYLDTTFFSRSYQRFPTRDESLDEICEIIKNWIEQDKKNIVNLHTSAYYGYEFLFLELYNRLKMPIHVRENAFDVYKYFPDLDEATTQNGDNTQIHSSCGYSSNKICKYSLEYNTKYIRVSAFSWKTCVQLENGISLTKSSGGTFVCYSTHASFEEGYEFIKFLKPKEIVPCVNPQKEEARQEMNDLIKMTLEELHTTETESEGSEAGEMLFPMDEIILREGTSDRLIEESILRSPPRMMPDDNIYDSVLLESPPRKMMKKDI